MSFIKKLKLLVVIYFVRVLSTVLRVNIPVVASATALIKKNKKMLFIKLSYRKGYGLPGGLCQPNETFEETLKRELYEETGLRVLEMGYFGSYFSNFFGIPTISCVYEVKVYGKLRGSSEGEPIWINPYDVIDNLSYRGSEEIITKFINEQ